MTKELAVAAGVKVGGQVLIRVLGDTIEEYAGLVLGSIPFVVAMSEDGLVLEHSVKPLRGAVSWAGVAYIEPWTD
jgi:hypothetical protein